MYAAKVPGFFWRLFPEIVWRVPTKEKTLYLTFDDGPTPDVTGFVLDTLDSYNAKATFFCVGKNVVANPELFETLSKRGHAIGNHTHYHLNGWDTDDELYFDNIAQCAEVVRSNLFRPPYGKISLSQMNFLKAKYKIVMWDVLSADFDTQLSPEKCLYNILHHAREGSIVVLHDSVKAAPNLKFALPRALEHFAHAGYQFKALN